MTRRAGDDARRLVRRAAAVALALAVAACAELTPVAPPPPDEQPARDYPKGPGIFTGEQGEWVIYGK